MSDPLSLSASEVEALPAPEAEAALDAWVRARRPELPVALAASTSKAMAKLARKALYRLKSAGVALPEAPRASPAQAAPPPTAAEEESALPAVVSPVMADGTRAFFFARPRRGGGLSVFQGMVSDEQGLLSLEEGESNRSVYRKRLKELRGERGLALVPVERALALLGRAMALGLERQRPPPPDAQDVLNRLGVQPQPWDWELPASEATDVAASFRAAALFDEVEVAAWAPPEAEVVLLQERLKDAGTTVLELTPVQQAEQRARRVKQSAQAYFTPEVRRRWARRLWETAEVLETQQRAEAAELARATARHLYRAEEATLFCEVLFSRLVPPDPGQPGQAAPAAPQAPGRSLILP